MLSFYLYLFLAFATWLRQINVHVHDKRHKRHNVTIWYHIYTLFVYAQGMLKYGVYGVYVYAHVYAHDGNVYISIRICYSHSMNLKYVKT